MIAELYQRFYGELVRYVAAMTRDESASQDIVQETFLRALKNAALLDSLDQRKCRAWLYRTSRNVFFDLARRAAAAPEPGDTDEFEDDLTRPQTAEALGLLSPGQRQLFVMRYFGGYDATELGRIFGLPPATVRSRLNSARKKLLEYYEEREN